MSYKLFFFIVFWVFVVFRVVIMYGRDVLVVKFLCKLLILVDVGEVLVVVVWFCNCFNFDFEIVMFGYDVEFDEIFGVLYLGLFYLVLDILIVWSCCFGCLFLFMFYMEGEGWNLLCYVLKWDVVISGEVVLWEIFCLVKLKLLLLLCRVVCEVFRCLVFFSENSKISFCLWFGIWSVGWFEMFYLWLGWFRCGGW